MRRRIAATTLFLAGSSVVLTGCDGQLIDAIESAAPSVSVALPSAPALPTEQPPAETAPQEPPQPTEEPPTEQPATEQPPAEDTVAESDTGISPWLWVLLGLVLLAIGLAIAAARRRRGGDDTTLAAQADGQIAWVRSNVDDPLVRWRADQLRSPSDRRDTDSELARRWTLVDQRATAATNDLLTLESSTKDDGLRQAATMLRQATEGYRTSIDALAQSIATGEQARIAQASQALAADTTLLDQGRQRFRTAAKL
ncbi:MAG: hypothetical protein WCA29_12755 [Jiangellales bacterium]